MDARIPMSGNTNAFNVAEPIMNAIKIKGAMDQNALFNREMQERDAIDAAYRDSGGDINAMMQDPRVGVETRMKVGDMQASQQKAQKAAQVQDLDFMIKGAEYTGMLASSAKTQQDWDAVAATVAEMLGPEALGRFPKEFNPENQQKVIDGSMTGKTRFEQMKFEQQQANADRRFDQGERRIDAALSSRGDGGNGDKWEVALGRGAR